MRRAPDRKCSRRTGFTMIELMVVIGIIGLLFAVLITAGSWALTNAKIKQTEVTLTIVQQALDQFAAEPPPLVKARQRDNNNKTVRYIDRYGPYPPDESELFTSLGLIGSDAPPANRSLAPGTAALHPDLAQTGNVPAMTYRVDLPVEDQEGEHRDMVALLVALSMSPKAQLLIDRIADQHRSPGPLGANGEPLVYLNRDNVDDWSAGDTQIRYITDDWGVPLYYCSQRDWVGPPEDPPPPSSNGLSWNRSSTQMVQLAGGKPIIMSFGPDGEDQLTGPTIGNGFSGSNPKGGVLPHDDWGKDGKLNNERNLDNIFATPELKDKLQEGNPE